MGRGVLSILEELWKSTPEKNRAVLQLVFFRYRFRGDFPPLLVSVLSGIRNFLIPVCWIDRVSADRKGLLRVVLIGKRFSGR